MGRIIGSRSHHNESEFSQQIVRRQSLAGKQANLDQLYSV